MPVPTDLNLGNYGVNLEATILYADIDGSTTMVDTLASTISAEIYKSFLHASAKIIKSESADITAYDGDRVMAIFLGKSKNTSAVRTALKINHAVRNIINPSFKDMYKSSNFVLKHCVGIDTSPILAARIGVRGDNDIVWVGPAANYAAKMSSSSESPYSTFISEAIYNNMDVSVKKGSNGIDMWERRTWKNKIVYRSNYYWEFP